MGNPAGAAGGGPATGDFPLRKEKNIMGLKHWILPNNQFKTHLFFFQFLGGGDPSQLGSWPEGWLKLQSSLEKPSVSVRGPISFRFMARRSFFVFLFFSTRGGPC